MFIPLDIVDNLNACVFTGLYLQGHLCPLNRCHWQAIKKNPPAKNINIAPDWRL